MLGDGGHDHEFGGEVRIDIFAVDLNKTIIICFLYSNHPMWRYQDLYYFVGLLKFTHRLIKTFQVVIKFEVDDEEFQDEHYLPFESIEIIERDLAKVSKLDRAMHKEFMRKIPLDLATLYDSSISLDRFLRDLNELCSEIYQKRVVESK